MVYFGANVNMTNFGGDLWFTGATESANGVTVNGAVKARHLDFDDDAFMTINTTILIYNNLVIYENNQT